MLLKKTGFPQEDELVLCTISNIQYHSVFAVLDEYGKSGMIHISEVAPGRIRNIREFVTEGKKVVCKVLKVTEAKGYIDLSLRRVNEAQKRLKLNEIKKEQLAESIIEYVAKKRKEKVEALYQTIADKLVPNHGGVYPAFEQVALAGADLASEGIAKTIADELATIIRQRIKPPQVEISGILKLSSHQPNGIEVVRGAIATSAQDGVDIKYLGGGQFGVHVISTDYKSAENLLDRFIGAVSTYMKKQQSTAEWIRNE